MESLSLCIKSCPPSPLFFASLLDLSFWIAESITLFILPVYGVESVFWPPGLVIKDGVRYNVASFGIARCWLL